MLLISEAMCKQTRRAALKSPVPWCFSSTSSFMEMQMVDEYTFLLTVEGS